MDGDFDTDLEMKGGDWWTSRRDRCKCYRGERKEGRLERRFTKLENIAKPAKYPNQAARQLAERH